MLRGILGFLPLVLDLAGIFLGLALNRLSLVLSLLAQTHDRLLLYPAAPALTHADTYGPRSRLSCRRDAALRWLQVPRRMKLKPSSSHAVSSSRISGAGPAQERLRILKVRTRQRQAASDRRQRWSPNRRSRSHANKMARAIQPEHPERPFGVRQERLSASRRRTGACAARILDCVTDPRYRQQD
jgi:hypothetical protein